MKNTNKHNIIRMLAAFFIPAAVMLFVYACMGVYPFGGRSLLCNDLQAQYVSFFAYLKEFGAAITAFFTVCQKLSAEIWLAFRRIIF